MSAFIIIPTQLYYQHLPPEFDYFLVEHPVHFLYHNYNKAKLLMHRYTMKKFYKHIKKTNKVQYIEIGPSPYDAVDGIENIFKKYKHVVTYDPVDHYVTDDFITLAKKHKCNLNFIPSPGWIEGSTEYVGGRVQTNFYKWQRIRLNLFPHKMNPLTYDDKNRDPFDDLTGVDKGVYAERVEPHPGRLSGYNKAVAYVQKYFPDNPGECKYWLPSDHQEAVKYLHDFFKYRFHNFGKYEDAIHPDVLFGYHAVMSPIINIGLLTPDFIISEVKKVYKKYPFQSVEGFIRQIIGWREYCRYIYVTDGPVYGNRFGASKPLPNYWYYPTLTTTGGSDIPEIIMRLILKSWQIGYLHHIERLMIISNFLNYTEIRPDHCYKWFMSAFLDSYHVFMDTNLYGMAMDVIDKTKKYSCPYKLPQNWDIYGDIKKSAGSKSRSYMSNRMYICGSNYIKKMGWPISKEDAEIIDDLYRRFVKKHRKYLASNYANARNVAHLT